MDRGLLLEGLTLIGSIGFLFAVFYAFKLSKETKHERYWLVLAVGALFLALHQWLLIPWEFHLLPENVKQWLGQISAIIGSILMAYSVHGLHDSLRKIKEKLP